MLSLILYKKIKALRNWFYWQHLEERLPITLWYAIFDYYLWYINDWLKKKHIYPAKVKWYD